MIINESEYFYWINEISESAGAKLCVKVVVTSDCIYSEVKQYKFY